MRHNVCRPEHQIQTKQSDMGPQCLWRSPSANSRTCMLLSMMLLALASKPRGSLGAAISSTLPPARSPAQQESPCGSGAIIHNGGAMRPRIEAEMCCASGSKGPYWQNQVLFCATIQCGNTSAVQQPRSPWSTLRECKKARAQAMSCGQAAQQG